MERCNRHRRMVLATMAIAAAHFWLGCIGLLGRLNYTVPSSQEIIEIAASTGFWVPAHFASGALLLVGIKVGGGLESRACSVSVMTMGVWAFFNLMWGLTVISPVSLAPPGLACLAIVGGQLLADAWGRGRYDKGR